MLAKVKLKLLRTLIHAKKKKNWLVCNKLERRKSFGSYVHVYICNVAISAKFIGHHLLIGTIHFNL